MRRHKSLSLETSPTALSSVGKHPCCECCLRVCRAVATLMVCAGGLEHPFPVLQQSDGCVLQVHSSFSKPMSIITLSSACRYHGHECCLVMCRVAAILMVCAGKLELAHPPFQSPDGCVLTVGKLPLSADVFDSSCHYERASWL